MIVYNYTILYTHGRFLSSENAKIICNYLIFMLY